MSKANKLSEAIPHDLERKISVVGRNLRIARLRRNLTVKLVAERIGTGPRAVMDAENGKPTTSFLVYGALLRCYGMLDSLSKLAEVESDDVGIAHDRINRRVRARTRKTLSNEF